MTLLLWIRHDIALHELLMNEKSLYINSAPAYVIISDSDCDRVYDSINCSAIWFVVIVFVRLNHAIVYLIHIWRFVLFKRSKKMISGFECKHPSMKYELFGCVSSVYCRHLLVSDKVNYSSKLNNLLTFAHILSWIHTISFLSHTYRCSANFIKWMLL